MDSAAEGAAAAELQRSEGVGAEDGGRALPVATGGLDDAGGAAGGAKRTRVEPDVQDAVVDQHPEDIAQDERTKVQLMSEWCALVKLYDAEKRKAHVRVNAAAAKVDDVALCLSRIGVYMPLNFSD